MRLHSNIGAALATGFVLFTMWGAAETAMDRIEGTKVVIRSPAPPAFDYSGTLPAFPGAEGYGASALDIPRDSVADGSWDFELHVVTDTATTGAGTLDAVRTAIRADTTAYHLVVFSVAGGFQPGDANGGFNLNGMKNVHFAFQTAPGTGFRFRGGMFISSARPNSKATDGTDVVFRYCMTKPTGARGFWSIHAANRFIFDHCSMQFGQTEDNGEFFLQKDAVYGGNDYRIENVTISWSLFGPGVEAGAKSPFGYRADDQTDENRWGFVDAHHNLAAFYSHRAPKTNVQDTEGDGNRGSRFISNYLYSVDNQAFESVDTVTTDWINNVVNASPSWDNVRDRFFTFDHDTRMDPVNPVANIYMEGNRVINGPTGWNPPSTQDSLLYRVADAQWIGNDYDLRRFTPLASAPIPITQTSSSGLLAALVDSVGAYRAVNCYGDWYDRRDANDDQLISFVESETGNRGEYLSRTAANTAGFSVISRVNGTACDFGAAGTLPDSFEIRYFGVADTVTISADHDSDGYLTAEEWVNGTDPTDGEPPPSGACETYSGGRCVFLFPLVGVLNNDTLIVVGSDTYSIKYGTADLDSVPILPPTTYGSRQWIPSGHDSAIVLTCETISTADQDSATIESIFTAWGFTGDKPWEVDPPRGCP